METILVLLEKINRSKSPIITLVSLLLLLGTAFYTSRAATNAIERVVENHESRISAIELDRKPVPSMREEFAVFKEKVNQEQEDIKEIKQDVKDIKNFLLVK